MTVYLLLLVRKGGTKRTEGCNGDQDDMLLRNSTVTLKVKDSTPQNQHQMEDVQQHLYHCC